MICPGCGRETKLADVYTDLRNQCNILMAELSRYKRAMAVAKERISRHWSGHSEDTCVEIETILQEKE